MDESGEKSNTGAREEHPESAGVACSDRRSGGGAENPIRLGVDDLLPATLQALFDRALAEGRGENEMAACFEMLRRRRV